MLHPRELVIQLYDQRPRADEWLPHQEDKKITITDRGEILSSRNHILQEVLLTIPGIRGIGIQIATGAIMDQAGIRTRLTHHQIAEAAVVQHVRVRHPAQERMGGLGAGTN